MRGAAESSGFFNTFSAASSVAPIYPPAKNRGRPANPLPTAESAIAPNPTNDRFLRRAAEADQLAFHEAISAVSNGPQIEQLHSLGELVAVRGNEDLILGEMSCMSYQRRTATIVALGDGEVLEIRRNMLYMLQRNPKAREMLDNAYRERALRAGVAIAQSILRPASELLPRRAAAESPTSNPNVSFTIF